MVRVGPNQDINNPATIIELSRLYDQSSDDLGRFLAESNAKDPNVSWKPIADVSIPFKMLDGSVKLFHGSGVNRDNAGSILTYDTDLVANAVISTYVNLAERFRGYWVLFNNVLDQLADWSHISESIIMPGVFFNVTLDNGGTQSRGTLGGINITETTVTHLNLHPSSPLPEWSGVGPTNYNAGTYPQLLKELDNVLVTRQTNISQIETNFKYLTWNDQPDILRFLMSSLADSTFKVGSLTITNEAAPNGQFVQLYNPTSSDVNVDFSLHIDASFDLGTVAPGSLNTDIGISLISWAEIGTKNAFPTPSGNIKTNFPSTQISQFNFPGANGIFGGTSFLDMNRTIVIPSERSAYVAGVAIALTVFTGGGSVNTTITLDSRELIFNGTIPAI